MTHGVSSTGSRAVYADFRVSSEPWSPPASTSRKAWWAFREERNETSKDSCAGLTLVWELDKSMIPYVLRE